MVNTLDHVADDLAWGVPDTELLAELGVEGFEEGLIKVVDGVGFVESSKEAGLDTVEGVGGMIEDLDDLDGVECPALGDGVEELAEDGDSEVVGGETPVEGSAGSFAFGGAAPEDPGGKDAVEKGLDEGGEEEVFALVALEGDTEGVLQGGLYGGEGSERVQFGTGAGFAGVGGE